MNHPDAVSLPDGFLRALVGDPASTDTVAIVLGGSYALGDATPYSDVDIAHIAAARRTAPTVLITIASASGQRGYASARLVSPRDRASPERHLPRGGAPSGTHPVFDPDSTFRAFQQEPHGFSLASLQQAADAYVSETMAQLVETAHKILSAGARQRARPVRGKCKHGVSRHADRGGAAGTSSRSYMPQVQDAAGPASAWTRLHRLLVGRDATPMGVVCGRERGITALRLYQETAALVRSSVGPAHRTVVEQGIDIIEDALSQLEPG